MAAIDYQATLKRFGFDQDLFCEMAQLFRRDVALRLQRVDEAVALNDAAAISDEAHALKGMAASFDAERLVAATSAIELEARARGRTPDRAAVDELRAACEEVIAILEAYAPELRAVAS